MQELGIGAVLALGTKALSEVETVSIDILDMEQAFLMQHFDACFAFLHRQEQRHVPTLVHCVYGQSRSAAICVAFLMHSEQLSLRQSYDRVQAARPCIYINSGFLSQLALFEAMQCQLLGSSPAHATVSAVSPCNLHLGVADNVVRITPKSSQTRPTVPLFQKYLTQKAIRLTKAN
ncbi:hypothetical protein B5M09_002276 [Aphanomyces astaci]|uniref:Protein-tyrosine-phosphatase n=1 Tax=Aphanomyces astaci TaxID=112090 RepID=A0A3R7WRA8_APHAT|nr:hypothetical protein B5M09_002276 [Aphanomyces astaci]